MKSLIFCLLIGSALHLSAEIQSIELEWNPKFCKKCYATDLNKLFETMRGVQEFQIDEQIGKANLKWKPDVRFSFSGLNLGMRKIGPRLRTVKISITGKLKHFHQAVTLISTGDDTQFQLFSSQEARHAKDSNRSLTSSIRNRLMIAEERGETASIKGRLFPPNHLVIDEIAYTPPKERKGRH